MPNFDESTPTTCRPGVTWKVKTLGFEPPPGFVWEGLRLDTDQGHRNYAVEYDPACALQAKVTVHYWKKDGQPDRERTQPELPSVTPEYWYASVAEAKAACELHAATDRFPPSLTPAFPPPGPSD